MAIWAIGDIQGCYKSFQKILEKINFNPKRDTLWVAGDLVNRGEGSLETLEYLYAIRQSVKIVLGNHDIALIGAYYGVKKSNPTIDPILKSPRARRLIDWLRRQKFLHIDYQLGFCMAHAGISPEFDLGMARYYANRIETKLQSDNPTVWLKEMLNNSVNRFDKKASSLDIDRYILNAFIRMRFCYQDSYLDFEQKGKPTQELREKGLKPWFECGSRKDIELKIVFGHWSTLGYFQNRHLLSLDTGCLWGKKLTVARLDSKNRISVEVVSLSCD